MSTTGAWYAQTGSKTRELYTIMHLPYTSMVLSYILIGASLSPSIYLTRLILSLVAYFLGLGISAHALNELHARHWGKELNKGELQILFVVPLIGAILIGFYGMNDLYESSGSSPCFIGAPVVHGSGDILRLRVQHRFFWREISQRPGVCSFMGGAADDNKLLCQCADNYIACDTIIQRNGRHCRY